MRARATILCTLLMGLAAVTSACGGGQPRDAYVKALNRAQTGLAERFGRLQARVTPTSTPAQDERALRGYETAVGQAVRDLRAVRPPRGLDALHGRFIDQIADYGTALRAARGELRSDDPRKILAAQGRLRSAVARAGERLNATIRAINAKLKG